MKSNFIENLRLAGFPLGLGLTSVLVSGTLNRVMIVEMGIPATLAGLFYALPLLISPLRVWLGYRSDAYPLWGLRREPLILFGALIAGLGVAGATLTLVRSNYLSLLIISVLIGGFIIYGFGRNLSSNTFEALLADKFIGDQRPRAITFYKVAMFAGIILGALLLGRFLDPFSETRLLMIVSITAAGVLLLSIFSIIRQEPRDAGIQIESQEARSTAFLTTFKTMIWADPQIRRFFILVMVTVIGTLAQDVLLEPYAALVFNMSVGETTRLEAIWGVGTLLSMGAAGGWLIKRYGYIRVMRVGLVLGVIIFLGLILTGALFLTGVFLVLVFFLGVSTGLAASGMLAAVIDFTTPERAGLLMGLWGVAHNVGQATGNLIGGAVVDLVQALQGDALTAYGLVFALEAVLLFAALLLLNTVKITESRLFSTQHHQEFDPL